MTTLSSPPLPLAAATASTTATTTTTTTTLSFSMPESLSQQCPSKALLQLSSSSESNALRLAQELSSSLSSHNNTNNNNGDKSSNYKTRTSIHNNTTSSSNKETNSKSNSKPTNNNENHYPIELPPILSQYNPQKTNNSKLKTSKQFKHNQHNSNNDNDPLQTSKASTESILNSLTKIASGGSAASTTLRNLEQKRRQIENATHDIQNALSLRHLSNIASDALGVRNYNEAVKAISDYDKLYPSPRAKVIAGVHCVNVSDRTKDVLQRTILERYEEGVMNHDLKELSTLTPLLGMLGMADKGVGLYLKFASDTLSSIMNKDLEDDGDVEEKQMMQKKEEEAGVRISRAEAKRREEERRVSEVTVCTKLAKIYNTAVTFLRHHLPMVAYSLGEAEGDTALVQLINAEVEKRSIDVIRQYIMMKKLAKNHQRSNGVANMIEEKYLSGDGLQYDQQELFEGGKADGNLDKKTILDRLDDCGFKSELGSFMQVNSHLDELALLLQHTESYDRFIRHAVDEVDKARSLRKKQKVEERKKKWMQELENQGKDVTVEDVTKFDEEQKEMDKNRRIQDVLPKQTQLNDIVGEAGGYYSSLERTFLLASLQRAFQSVCLVDDRTYSPITILPPNRSSNAVGCNALQTSLVEESLYAAQRSTLRAFATGHNGTASAASNFCADILGRFLLEVLIHRADAGTALLKPGDGLLSGQGGLGQAALAVMSSAQKGLSKATTKGLMAGTGETETERMLTQQRIQEGIAMACANLNDLEVAVDYTNRLERRLLDEMKSTFPANKKETEQLHVCIKSLSGVKDTLFSASNEAMDHLVSTIMPRVRSIVNESVGQDNASTAGFMSGGTVQSNTVRMNYHLDDDAYEMAQLSEGYMSRL
jgi:cell fate (sporulation/competence/biofilm development) regulator YlbF (YheA/YmcA/DUF963 family)